MELLCLGVLDSINNVGVRMKIMDLRQGSKDWLLWRSRGIGASDTPAIMKESPWTTYLQLWLEKTGMAHKPPANEYQIAAMRRGVELEPIARELVEQQLKISFPAAAAEHDLYPFIKASFDGYNEEHNLLIEIKCPSKVDHGKAVKGKVPPKYYGQLQHQLLVSNAEKVYYCSYDGKDDLQIVEVFPDKLYQTKMLTEVLEFWVKVQKREMPEVTDKDRNAAETGLKKAREAYDRAQGLMDVISMGKMKALDLDPDMVRV